MTNKQLVLQTDFGLADGAVSTMYGVAKTVAPALHVADLTHEITPYNIWEASYRLYQTLNYWPVGTTFVSVVDPGVGSERKSVCALTKTGHYVITPDNGTLTHIAKFFGLKPSVRSMKLRAACLTPMKVTPSTAAMSMLIMVLA